MIATALFCALVSQGSISGRVTDRASAQPLPRMLVTLAAANGVDRLEMLTDADGRYRFTGLAAGKYAVSAGNDEYRATYLTQWFGETEPSESLRPPRLLGVILAAGESRTGVDIALTRALAIEGHVLDPWDVPIAGAGISVERADGRGAHTRSSTSDDLGAYRVYGLRPGRYHVCALGSGRLEVPGVIDGLMLAKTCHPAAIAEANAGDVILTAQDASNIDIRVQRVNSLSIAGTVTDAAGVAIDGAHVDAIGFTGLGSSSAVTQAGSFTLSGLLAGRYLVRASYGDPRPGRAGPGAGSAEMAYAIADLAGAGSVDLAMVLSGPVTVRGRLVFDGGPPPPGGHTRVLVNTHAPELGPGFFEQYPFAVVADDSTFELTGVYRLPMLIGIQNVPAGWALKSVRYGDRDVTFTPTEFGTATPVALDVVLTNRVARPSLRVTDAQGHPVQAARVIRLPAAETQRKSGLPAFLDDPSSDGVVSMDAVVPGDYLFAAFSLDDWSLMTRGPLSTRLEDIARVATKVTLSAGDVQTIALTLAALPEKR